MWELVPLFICLPVHSSVSCPFISVQLIHSSTHQSNIIKLLVSDLAEVLSKMGDEPNVQKQLEYSFKHSHTESEIKGFLKCFTNDWPNDCLRAKAQKLHITTCYTKKGTAANKPVSKLGPLFAPKKHGETSRSMSQQGRLSSSPPRWPLNNPELASHRVWPRSQAWKASRRHNMLQSRSSAFFLFIRNDVPPVVGHCG